jgi:vancomycin permeability regulator SanA
MLEDRLLQGMALYNNTKTKILVSGDHMNKGYDEVNVMKNYLINKNIPSEDIFMDHAGISTYDSIYRAKYIFNAKKIIIVTQEYHMYRSLYIAEKLDIEAYGVTSNPRKYRNQKIRDIREFLARTKDFFKATFKFKSTYLGEKIPLNKSGDITND